MSGYVLVRVGLRSLGLPLAGVEEVVPVTDLLAAPGARAAVRGVLPVRGRLVPLVHLGALLTDVAAPAAVADTAIVVATTGGRMALEVDEVNDLVPTPPDRVPSGWEMPWAVGMGKVNGALVPVVDLDALAERLRPAPAGGPA